MPTSFLHLPGEIRNQIYKHLLVHDRNINPWRGDHNLSPSILAANKTILREASSILYGNNCFDFTLRGRSPYWIQVFFGTIGIINMGYVRSICLDFPRFDYKNETLTLNDMSLSNLAIIEGFCTRLETVTMTPASISLLIAWLEYRKMVDSSGSSTHDIYGPILAQVDFALRANPTVKHIIAEGHWSADDKFAMKMQRVNGRKEMERLGWTIRDVKLPNDDEDKWCCSEDNETCYGLEI